MDIRAGKKCAILNDSDLQENIEATLKTIAANPEKFYLLDDNSKYHLHRVINLLDDALDELDDDDIDVQLTRIRFARNITFTLRTFLQTGDVVSDDGGLTVHSLSDLLEELSYDETGKIKGLPRHH